MRIAVVDDEVHWREKAKYVIEKYFGIDVPKVDTYVNGETFLHAGEYYGVVFMDIEMDRIDGFQTIMAYKEKYPKVCMILLTTHREFVTKGYEVEAFRFIYKDIMEQEIPRALQAYRAILEKNEVITVNVIGVGELPIRIKDIIYVTVEKRNSILHTREGDFRSTAVIQEIEDRVLSYGFFRAHKSFLVNLCEVEWFDKRDIMMKDKTIAYMSGRRYPDFKAAYLYEKMKVSNG